jgi:metal-responsive CopG/Arc/MetJ family transcriptional regulator
MKKAPVTAHTVTMQLVTVLIPRGLLKQLDDLVAKRLYPNRAEAIRSAIHDLVERESSV